MQFLFYSSRVTEIHERNNSTTICQKYVYHKNMNCHKNSYNRSYHEETLQFNVTTAESRKSMDELTRNQPPSFRNHTERERERALIINKRNSGNGPRRNRRRPATQEQARSARLRISKYGRALTRSKFLGLELVCQSSEQRRAESERWLGAQSTQSCLCEMTVPEMMHY